MMHRSLAALLSGLALLAASAPAFGYCRATTCGSESDDYCTVGEGGCVIDGLPLGWPAGSTVHFALDEDSADEAGIDGAEQSVEDAVGAWDAVRCDDERADISVAVSSASGDDDAAAVVTIEFISVSWPYEENAAGRTIIEFDEDAGSMLGAAIYLNAEQYVFRLSPRDLEVDLTGVLTHEIGHVLALAHTEAEGATMQAKAESGLTSGLNTLESDDQAGLCALYPPDANTVVFNLGGGGEGGSAGASGDGDEDPAAGTGCSHSAVRPSGSGWLSALLLLAAAAGTRAARRRRCAVGL